MESKAHVKLTERQLQEEIPIIISEQNTVTLFHIPSSIFPAVEKLPKDEEELQDAAIKECEANTKKYKKLCEIKVSSDAFIEHGTQTFNLTQKTREIDFQGFTQEDKKNQATNWDIDDARHMERITDAKRQENEYLALVDEILTEKSKHKAAFIDAEALASHISIGSETVAGQSRSDKAGKSQSGATNSSKQKGMSKNVKSSNTNLNQSQTSERDSDKSTSQTQTNPISSDAQTGGGAYGVIKKAAEFVDEELPDSIMKAIKIIERLLTQNAFHEQHVLYKNYPPVKLGKVAINDDEEEGNTKKRPMGIKKEKAKEDEEKKDEEEMKEGQVWLKPLFTFQCDLTAGRQVSCIDINLANQDLIAVGYGETDINITDYN